MPLGKRKPAATSRYVKRHKPRSRVSAARTIQSRWRKYKSKPSRLRVSSTRTYLTKAIARQINNMSENKFVGHTVVCAGTQPKPAGTQPISYFFYNTGLTLTQPGNSMFNAMGLYTFPKGDNSNQRNGDYMYIKKTHLKMEFQMLPFSDNSALAGLSSLTEFRVMIVKANRKFNKLGESPIAGESLFLGTENEQYGFASTTFSTYSNMQQPINKRKWLVYMDKHFTLTTPAQEYNDLTPDQVTAINTAASGRYPSKKFLNINLPIYKKCHFPSDQNVPDSVDTQWMLIVQCARSNYCNPGIEAPRNVAMNLTATTSALDN